MIRETYRRHRRAACLAAGLIAVALTLTWLVLPAVAGMVAAGLGLTAVWGLAVALWFSDHWETVERHGGRALGALSQLSTRAERVGLSAELQGTINGARVALSDELPDIMPYPARVKFVRNQTDISTLRDGEVIISLKDPSQHAENVARATLAYVSTSVVRPARPYVAKPVMTAIDYSITKRILRTADRHALDFFLTDLWEPALSDQPDLRSLCAEVETIERKGLLTRVLLAEFLDLGRRLYGEYPSDLVRQETRDFVSHLAKLASRGPEEEMELDFKRGQLRVGVVLVGDRAKAERLGPQPYVARCLVDIRSGCGSIYLLARGARCELVREIVQQLESNGRVLDAEIAEYVVEFDGDRVDAICAKLAIDQTSYSPSTAARSIVVPSTAAVAAYGHDEAVRPSVN